MGRLVYRAVDPIIKGAAVTGRQYSCVIRAASNMENPVHEPRSHGELQRLDLSLFKNLPFEVTSRIADLGEDQALLLYELRHFRGEERFTDGYLVTTMDHELLFSHVTNPRSGELRLFLDSYELPMDLCR